MSQNDWVIVIHGGAGAMRSMGADKEALYRAGLESAVLRGAQCLRDGGLAVEAAVEAVAAMEARGDFNAGHGSCLTTAGQVEVDAAVMNGADQGYGAVAAVPALGNAVRLADVVRTKSAHCLFAGAAALSWAEDHPEFIWKSPTKSSSPEKMATSPS